MRVCTCPVCNGAGLVSRPPWVAGDVPEWTDNKTGPYSCRSCGGRGYLVIGNLTDGRASLIELDPPRIQFGGALSEGEQT